MVDWFENEELFRAQLERGHEYAERIAAELRAAGLQAEATPLRMRETVEDRWRFQDEQDVLVGPGRRVVEVKSRDLAFTRPGDYPYPTVIIDTVRGWEAKQRKPVAIVVVSQRTDGRVVVPRSTRGEWRPEERHDRVRGITDIFFEVPAGRTRPWPEFVAWLLATERREGESLLAYGRRLRLARASDG